MKRLMRQTVIVVCKVLVVTACGFASLFVLASGYESVYNRSLPYVHTLDPVDISAIAQAYDLQQYTRTDPSMYGKFGKPATLKLTGAESQIRMDLGGPINQHGQWLARATGAQAIIPVAPRKGNIGTLLLYCRASFRTVSASNLPANGSNVFVDTDQHWRYVYKVITARTYPAGSQYVPTNSSGSKLLVVCNDAAQAVTNIIEADLLSVQGADL